MKFLKRVILVFLFSISSLLLCNLIINHNTISNNSLVFSEEKQAMCNKSSKHIVTIFVHGTILPYPAFDLIQDIVNGTYSQTDQESMYANYLHNLRYKGVYKCQPIDDLGLLKIDVNTIKKPVNNFYADFYRNIYNSSMGNDDDISFYTFGWNGRLDKTERKVAGKTFYTQLVAELQKLKEKHKDKQLFVEVLSHSHGGNVSLNLAAAEKELQQGLYIDRLVMFGTPVQTETQDFIQSDVFKKVYNFYSRSDALQVIDIISTQDAFSKRRFTPSEKLHQVEIKINDIEPLHNELWLLHHNDNFLYRKKLCIDPFPLAIFSPMITHVLDANKIDSQNLLLKIIPNDNDLNFIFQDIATQKEEKSELIQKIISFSYTLYDFVQIQKRAFEMLA